MTVEPRSDRRLFAPVASRAAYLRQAAFIALGIVVAIGCLVYVMEHDGSFLLLLAAELALVIACGTAMTRTLAVIGAAVGSLEGIVVVLAIGVLLAALPLLAVVFLVLALVQAIRAG